MQRWTDRGAAIIAQGDKIILMRRERGFGKNKQIYYTIPGGGREEGEKIEETAIREIKEELGIDIKIKKLMYKLNTYMRMQYIFLGEYVSGILGTGEGEEYEEENYKKYGKYIPQVVSFEKLKKIKLVPETLKKEIIRDYLYIIGKSKKKYTLKILQEESKKRVQNRKYFKKEETSKDKYLVEDKLNEKTRLNKDKNNKKGKIAKNSNRKNASNKSNISANNLNKKKEFVDKDITLEEKERLKRIIRKQQINNQNKDEVKKKENRNVNKTTNKATKKIIDKNKNNVVNKDNKKEISTDRKIKNRDNIKNIKRRNNKIKKMNVTKK